MLLAPVPVILSRSIPKRPFTAKIGTVKKNYQPTILAIATAVLAAAGSAQSLAERDKIAQDKVQLADYSKRVNSACGTHIQFSIDYASYQGKTPGPGVRRQSYTEYLMNAGDAIINVCKTEAGKGAVAEKIHSVVGAYADGEEESLADGVFKYRVGFSGGSIDHPEKFLKSHL